MFIKRRIYNIVILFIYLITCFTIFQNNKEISIHTNIEENSVAPIEKDSIGQITIDKLKLKKTLYKIESKKNNVDQNVTILKESTFPNQEESILLIAAHSGDSNISYFEHLDELEKNDIIKITYLNKEYLYQVDKIWEEPKNGYIHINKESKKQLVLTTCSPNHKDKQLIISSRIV